jgi:ribosomal-protein-alanine N-acetyltransferase
MTAETLSPQTKAVAPGIRWMIRRDMAEVIAIENASFEHPLTEENFLSCLRNRNCIGQISEFRCPDKVVGYMVYELYEKRMELINFAVHPDHRRQGIGTTMLAKLIEKLNPSKRTTIELDVPERFLDALLFFRNQGFKAVKLVRNMFEDIGEDGIRMVYEYKEETKGEYCERT